MLGILLHEEWERRDGSCVEREKESLRDGRRGIWTEGREERGRVRRWEEKTKSKERGVAKREEERSAHARAKGEREGEKKKKRDIAREGEVISPSRARNRGTHKREREREMNERKGERRVIGRRNLPLSLTHARV